MTRPKASTDAHALRLIAEGRILVDPDTGVILVDGQPRGSTTKAGYQRVYVDGVLMLSHRVVYMFVHGRIPDGLVINHRDSNRQNNRIANLEAVTYRQNTLHGKRSRNYVSEHHPKPEYWAEPAEDTLESLMQQPPNTSKIDAV